jgi:hypothetical protein
MLMSTSIFLSKPHVLTPRVRFDLRLDYTPPPVPPLAGADVAWAQELITARGPGHFRLKCLNQMPMPASNSGLRDNHTHGTVADFLKGGIRDGSRLSVVSAYWAHTCLEPWRYGHLRAWAALLEAGRDRSGEGTRAMAEVERGWFRIGFAGQALSNLYNTEAWPTADFDDLEAVDPATELENGGVRSESPTPGARAGAGPSRARRAEGTAGDGMYGWRTLNKPAAVPSAAQVAKLSLPLGLQTRANSATALPGWLTTMTPNVEMTVSKL